MTTNEPPPYPGDSEPGATPPPSGSGEPPASEPPSYGSAPPPTGDTPPPPPPPPPAPGGSAEGFSPPNAIGWGWRKFTENAGQVILAGVIWLVIYIVATIIGGAATGQSGYGMGGPSFSVGVVVSGIIVSTVTYTIGAIIARGALDVADGQPFSFGSAAGKINFANVVIASFIVAVIVQVGLVLLVIPGIVAAFLAWFFMFYVVDDTGAPMEAITASVKLVSSRVGDSLLLALLSILVMIAGAIALIVGLVVAYPVVLLASAYAYRSFRGQPVEA